MESKSIDTTCVKDDDESDELDEFFDATDKSFDCGNSDFYDDDVQFISQEPCLYYDQIKEDYDELALMLNSTLASEYNGANAARIIAHFFSDWKIVLENKANDMGFPDVDALLKHCDYIEQVSFVNGCAVYRAACKPENEHILQRVADCYLEEHQKNEKRRIQKLIELKNPENAKNYIEGKRRILQILMDLNAYEIDVDYEFVRKEYMRRYEVSLNSSEHHRLFMNRSASKNLCRVFVQEVTITSYNPIHLRLKSASVKIPDEINEDLQILASSENIELPTFPTKNQSCLPVAVPKKKMIECLDVLNSGDESGSASKEMSDEKSSSICKAEQDDFLKTIDRSTYKRSSSSQGSESHTCMSDLGFRMNDDKYTGDEESSDSSDSEVNISRKQKRSSGNRNTFNIPRVLSDSHHGYGGRLAKRSLQQSLKHSTSNERHQSASQYFPNASDKATAGEDACPVNAYSSPAIGSKCRDEDNKAEFSEYGSSVRNRNKDLNNLPYGSYSVPNFAANQKDRQEGMSFTFTFIFYILTLKNFECSIQNSGTFFTGKASDSSRKNVANGCPKNYFPNPNRLDRMVGMEQARSYQPAKPQPPDKKDATREYVTKNISSSNSAPHVSNKLSEGTQTDDDWLEQVLAGFGSSVVNSNPLQRLSNVIKMIVEARSPNPVLLSALPQIVASVYGGLIDPEKDQCYRKTWRTIVKEYCVGEIIVVPLPNGEEVLIKQ